MQLFCTSGVHFSLGLGLSNLLFSSRKMLDKMNRKVPSESFVGAMYHLVAACSWFYVLFHAQFNKPFLWLAGSLTSSFTLISPGPHTRIALLDSHSTAPFAAEYEMFPLLVLERFDFITIKHIFFQGSQANGGL